MLIRLIKEVLVFRNGAWRPTDIAIDGDRIAAVADPGGAGPAGPAGTVHDLKGLYASPGWVDIHTHLLPLRYGGVGTWPEKVGLPTGVTGLVDAGTVGAENFKLLHDRIIAPARLPIKVFLNIKKTGIRFWKVGGNERGLDDIAAMERVAAANPDLVVGVKVTASKEHMLDDDPMYYVRQAIEAGKRLRLPVVVHIGRTPPSLDEILPLMREGDVLTHVFRNGPHSIIGADGRIKPAVLDARARGVRFDIGHGVKSFAFAPAEAALAQGLTDFSISSDLYMLSTPYRAKNFAHVLDKFLALGLRLEDIMAKASTVPGRIAGLRRGIEPGLPASITLFKLVDGEFDLEDCWDHHRRSPRRIQPVAVVNAGRYLHCS
jgi:dihydroorotase